MEAFDNPIVVTPEAVASATNKLHMLHIYEQNGMGGSRDVYSFTPEERAAVDQMQQWADAVAAAESEGI